jgi:hypothetical protein|tara:strand:- start:4064 stop:4642 length:579 start_codon:yes stop_codon:yes gene_type:complete
MTGENEEFPVKVNNEIYGPVPVERIISDVKSGELTTEARFWDGEDWIPVSLLLDENERKDEVNLWNDDNWTDESNEEISENGPPLPASSAWQDIERKGRWIMIYGDHLVVEGNGIKIEDLGLMMEGEPRTGGIPMKKLLNVTFRETNKGMMVIASSFHKMYEVYSLKCQVSKTDSEEILKELKDAEVRIINN